MDLFTTLVRVTPGTPFVATSESDRDLDIALRGWIDSGLTARLTRGRKSKTTQSLFDEFAAALQFPYYFGENWHAFDDCMSEPDWLPISGGLVVIVRDAKELLSEEDVEDLARFVRGVNRAAEALGQAIELGEWWDRPPVPYHVVLQFPEHLPGRDRWVQAGARFLNACHTATITPKDE